jgi:hypothetical protein
MKKQRTIWLTDEHFKRLKEKANREFSGKGFLERYLELISDNPIIILKGDAQVIITPK